MGATLTISSVLFPPPVKNGYELCTHTKIEELIDCEVIHGYAAIAVLRTLPTRVYTHK
jgi:hypothetical protein